MWGNRGKMWDRNKSPVGWYVASLLMRFEWYDEDQDNLDRQSLAWENQILIKADMPEEAYAKALKRGQSDAVGEMWEADNEARKGSLKFEGFTSLLPVYDKLEEGSEISWTTHENKSVEKIKSWVKAKEELESVCTH
jgi:Domain of unknown function (DUF4288)